jgi:hypothetical protein
MNLIYHIIMNQKKEKKMFYNLISVKYNFKIKILVDCLYFVYSNNFFVNVPVYFLSFLLPTQIFLFKFNVNFIYLFFLLIKGICNRSYSDRS